MRLRNERGQVPPELMFVVIVFALASLAWDGVKTVSHKVGCKVHLISRAKCEPPAPPPGVATP